MLNVATVQNDGAPIMHFSVASKLMQVSHGATILSPATPHRTQELHELELLERQILVQDRQVPNQPFQHRPVVTLSVPQTGWPSHGQRLAWCLR